MIFEETLSPSFQWHGHLFQLFRSDFRLTWLLQWLSIDPNFDLLQLSGDVHEHLITVNEVVAIILAVPPGS
jgi:hypothetical protein